jgi:hypothetical protein
MLEVQHKLQMKRREGIILSVFFLINMDIRANLHVYWLII